MEDPLVRMDEKAKELFGGFYKYLVPPNPSLPSPSAQANNPAPLAGFRSPIRLLEGIVNGMEKLNDTNLRLNQKAELALTGKMIELQRFSFRQGASLRQDSDAWNSAYYYLDRLGKAVDAEIASKYQTLSDFAFGTVTDLLLRGQLCTEVASELEKILQSSKIAVELKCVETGKTSFYILMPNGSGSDWELKEQLRGAAQEAAVTVIKSYYDEGQYAKVENGVSQLRNRFVTPELRLLKASSAYRLALSLPKNSRTETQSADRFRNRVNIYISGLQENSYAAMAFAKNLEADVAAGDAFLKTLRSQTRHRGYANQIEGKLGELRMYMHGQREKQKRKSSSMIGTLLRLVGIGK